MKKIIILTTALLAGILYAGTKVGSSEKDSFEQTPISINAFAHDLEGAAAHRAKRRINAKTFLKYAEDKGTIILDTRSKAKYNLRHIKGALHLNFSDFTKESLAKVIPNKETRVLIYCNNNFYGDPSAFPAKSIATALNIPTFINLYSYGYENIYELGSYESVFKTNIQLVGQSN